MTVHRVFRPHYPKKTCARFLKFVILRFQSQDHVLPAHENTAHMFASRFTPLLLRDLRNYRRTDFTADLLAGLVVGIVALPLAIAFAIAASPGGDVEHTIGPGVGILTAIVAGILISALGGSRVQIGGPTGAFIVIIYGVVTRFGLSGLLIATVMAGILLVVLGLLRLGSIIKFIPYPIVVGFTSGIALTIFTTQVKDLLGLQIDGAVPAAFVDKWFCYARHLATVRLDAVIAGLGTIAVIVLARKVAKRLPGSLVAIVLATAVVSFTNAHGLTHIDTIGDRFGAITAALPPVTVLRLDLHAIFTAPDGTFTLSTLAGLLPTALVIAVLGAIESLLSATVADGVTGQHHDSNRELVGQGVANIVAPLFGGIPATGAIARTMTNINAGARTGVAGIVHALVLLVIFLVAMPLAAYIPMACLAGVLVVVSYNMSQWRTFAELLRHPKSDVTVLLVTFVLTVVFDLTVAIEVGLVMACLLFMRRMAGAAHLSIATDAIDPNSDPDQDLPLHEEALTIPPGVEVYEVNGPFFFGIANCFEEMSAEMQDHPAIRVIRMRKVPFIDSTGVHNLETLCRNSRRDGTQIILSGVRPEVRAVLERTGFPALLGEDNICSHISLALQRAEALTEAHADA